MGRNMFGPIRGPWQEDWRGWWGDEPSYRAPVFVLTHYEHEPIELKGGTTLYFVTDGFDAPFARAKGAAGERGVDIRRRCFHRAAGACSRCDRRAGPRLRLRPARWRAAHLRRRLGSRPRTGRGHPLAVLRRTCATASKVRDRDVELGGEEPGKRRVYSTSLLLKRGSPSWLRKESVPECPLSEGSARALVYSQHGSLVTRMMAAQQAGEKGHAGESYVPRDRPVYRLVARATPALRGGG